MFSCIHVRSENNVVSQRLVEKLQLPSTFHPNQAWIKFSTERCVKEDYVMLLPWTLIIFFWTGHGFVLKDSIEGLYCSFLRIVNMV